MISSIRDNTTGTHNYDDSVDSTSNVGGGARGTNGVGVLYCER